MSEIQRLPFEDWTLQSLEDTFGLSDDRRHPPMAEWLAVDQPTAPRACEELEQLRQALHRHARGWNEGELKQFFIGPLMQLVNFDGAQYGAYAARHLKAVLDGYEISGAVDGVIARGRYEAVSPYFCLHDFNSESDHGRDPAAKVLSAMLTARIINNRPQTVYGCYVIGRFWFFLTLDATEPRYTISRSFDASTEDVLTIFAVLDKLKQWVIARIDEISPAAA